MEYYCLIICLPIHFSNTNETHMTFFFEAFLLLFKKWLYFIQLSNYAAKIRFNIYTVYTYTVYTRICHIGLRMVRRTCLFTNIWNFLLLKFIQFSLQYVINYTVNVLDIILKYFYNSTKHQYLQLAIRKNMLITIVTVSSISLRVSI